MMHPAIALALLFTRFDAAPALLAHDARRLMAALVRARPGLRVGEVARELDVHYKTALHHARMLARHGLLVVEADGRARLLFPPESRGRAHAPPPPPPRVVRALLAVRAGARSPSTLARALGLPRGTAGSLLATLARRGLLVRDETGYRLSPEAAAALAAPRGTT